MEKGRIIGVARRLRREMTDAERRIWKVLRQVPFNRYVADFASHSRRLAIEIDGSQHEAGDPAEQARTRYLESRSYRVLRFWNRDVLMNTDGVAEAILRAVGAGTPHPPG